ncbi:sodium-coupled monocarboxylate transporter 1-like [Amphiura filiformis]|uniref:sodium-coupled monocarboxylate transporter 1-like n=1 Tax=Amphiura filiformis TaxID=82378 RepID=UPI003B221F42
MSSIVFSVYDWLVFSIILGVSVGIGIYYALIGGKQKTSKEYLLADKSMGAFPVAMSLLASLFTGIYVQGVTADVYYRGGTVGIWGIFSQTFSLWVAGRCFYPIYYKLELTSIYEYLEMRFNRAVQLCGLVVFFVYMIIHTSIATFAMGLALTAVTDINLTQAILILSIVCLIYTFLGGMKAVLWADCFQMFIVIGAVISLFIKSSISVGGVKEVWRIGLEGERIDFFNDFTWEASEYATFWNVLFGGVFGWLPSMAIMQYQVQRFLSCKDLKTGYIALAIYGWGMAFMTAACVIGGVFLYAIYAYCDPLVSGKIQFSDELLPFYILDSFHHLPGLSGLLVAGLCSLGLSTVSSVLSALAAVTGTHVVKGLMKNTNETRYVWITKCLVIFYSGVIIGGSFVIRQLGSIFSALVGFIGVINGPIMGVFILGVFVPRANSKGVMIGFFLSLGIGLWILIGSLIYPVPIKLLPLSTEGCPVPTVPISNFTTPIHTTTITTPSIVTTALGVITTIAPTVWPPISKLYALSKLWYPAVVTGASLVFGIFGSALTGFNDPKNINPDLICDLPKACCCFLPKRWQIWDKEKEYDLELAVKKSDGIEFADCTNNLPDMVATRDTGTSTST